MKMRTVFPIAIYRILFTLLSTSLGLILSGALTSCEKEDVKPRQEVSESWLLERLYFGRSMPGGHEVSVEDWNIFVDEVITPRFPDGLTLIDAQGQWQEEDGVITRESTFILEVVHLKSKADDEKMEAIIAEYKKRFAQESVLRVVHPVEVVF